MTPKLSWGLTAINPDVADLFLEQVKDGNYLTNDGKDWAPLEVRTEVIKVRFGSEVTLKVQKTRNGVILPPDMLSHQTKDLLPWVSPEIQSTDMPEGFVYALGTVYDRSIQTRLGHAGYD